MFISLIYKQSIICYLITLLNKELVGPFSPVLTLDGEKSLRESLASYGRNKPVFLSWDSLEILKHCETRSLTCTYICETVVGVGERLPENQPSWRQHMLQTDLQLTQQPAGEKNNFNIDIFYHKTIRHLY